MRGWVCGVWGALSLSAGIGLACGGGGAFTCQDDAQCGAGGTCQPTGGCSFPADDCDSGERYGDYAPNGLAGQCVSPGDATEGGGATTTGAGVSATSGPQTSTDATSMPPATTVSVDDTTATSGMTSGPPPETTAAESSSGGPGEDSSLLLWFRFDEVMNGGVLNSGYLQGDGQCMDGTCPASINGVDGDAASFAGMVGFTFPNVPELDLTDAFTIAAFVRSGDLAGTGPYTMCGKAFDTGNFNSWNWVFASGPDGDPGFEVVLYLNTTSTADYVAADFDYPADQWVHVTSVWDGAVASMYIDGVFVSEAALPTPGFDDNPISVGFDFNAGAPGQYYAGALDELRIYDRALSEQEIAVIANP